MDPNQSTFVRRTEVFECSICNNDFDDENNAPCCCGFCGNSICLLCLNNIMGKASNGQFPFTCPLCREKHELVNDKPKNFQLNKNFLAILKERNVKKQTCKNHPDSRATYACFDPKCAEPMRFCSLCMRRHKDCIKDLRVTIQESAKIVQSIKFPINIEQWKNANISKIKSEMQKIEKQMCQFVEIVAQKFSEKKSDFDTLKNKFDVPSKSIFYPEKKAGGDTFDLKWKNHNYYEELMNDINKLFSLPNMWDEMTQTVSQNMVFWSRKLFSDPEESSKKQNLQTFAKIKKIDPFFQQRYFLANFSLANAKNVDDFMTKVTESFLGQKINMRNWSVWSWKLLSNFLSYHPVNVKTVLKIDENELLGIAREIISSYGTDMTKVEDVMSEELTKKLGSTTHQVKVCGLPNQTSLDEEDISDSLGLTAEKLNFRIMVIGKTEG